MRMPFPLNFSGLGLAATLLATLALSGCSYKNPLIDGYSPPAQAGSQTGVQAGPQTGSQAAAPAQPAKAAAPERAASTKTAAPSAAGVEISQQKRRFGFLTPYRADVQQGNFISAEMVSQLRVGMTPDQVRFVLGTPLVTDLFHAGRWDYVFQLRQGNGQTARSAFTVHFRNDRLERWEGGDLPSEEDYLARIAGEKPKGAANPNAPKTPAAPRAPSTANEPR